MYNIEDKYYLANVNSDSRNLRLKLYVDDIEIDNSNLVDSIKLTYEIQEKEYMFGAFPIPVLELTLNNNVTCQINSTIKLDMEFECKSDNGEKYWLTIPYGIFKVSDQDVKEYITKFKAHHFYYYALSEEFKPDIKEYTTRNMLSEICKKTGIEVEGGIQVIPNYTLPRGDVESDTLYVEGNNYQGKSYFEQLCQIASLCGKSLIISRNNKLKFTGLTDTGITINNPSTPTRSQVNYNNTRLQVWLDDKNCIYAGTDENTPVANICELTNCYMTQERADELINIINKISYEQYDFKFGLSDLRLEPLDMISFTHKGEVKQIPIQYMQLVFTNKSIVASVKSFTKSSDQTITQGGFRGTINKQIANAYSQIEQTNERITSEVGVIKDEMNSSVSKIEQTAEQISMSVDSVKTDLKDNYSTTTEIESAIKVSKEEINLSVSKEINNIQIGGANIYSKDTTVSAMYHTSNLTRTDTGFSVLGHVDNDGTVRIANIIDSNGWYTISFDVKCQVNGWFVDVDFCDGVEKRFNNINTTDYTHCTYSYEVTNYSSDVYNFIDIGGLSAQKFWFKNIKVEKGNKETAYTPAFADIESSIAKIDVKANEINLSVNTIKTQGVGGNNLIKNGNFGTGDFAHWNVGEWDGQAYDSVIRTGADWEWGLDGKHLGCINTHSLIDVPEGHSSSVSIYQQFKTIPNKKYTVSYCVAGHRSKIRINVHKNLNEGWLGVKEHDGTWGGKDDNDWIKDSFTFTAETNISTFWGTIYRSYGTNAHLWITDICCVEGEVASKWIPCNDEYSTTTEMNSAIDIKANEITSSVNQNVTNTLNGYPTKDQMNSAIQQKADSITSTVEVTKMSGVELLPQGYLRNSSSGYHPIVGTFYWNQWGLYTDRRSWVRSINIPIDRNIPLYYYFYTQNTGGVTTQMHIGFEQLDWLGNEIGENASTHYVTAEHFTGYRSFEGVLPSGFFNSETKFIRLRWLANWDSGSMSHQYMHEMSIKQLKAISSSTQIAQMSDKIELKVEVDGVKSIIQQNPESVRIGFNAISNYFDLNSSRLQVGFGDGSYSQMGQGGFKYYDAYAGWSYHSLMKQGWLGQIHGTNWSRTITLPPSFQGKTFSVIISVSEVGGTNTHDVIKAFKVTVPHDTVNYANGTFVINGSAVPYWVPGQAISSDVYMDVSWIAIC